MKKLVFFFSLSIVALCACNKITDDNSLEKKVVSFTAVASNSDETKTELVESGSTPYTYSMSWTGDENVKVIEMPLTWPNPSDGQKLTYSSIGSGYDFSNKASGASATFTSDPGEFTPEVFKSGVQYLVINPIKGELYYQRATSGTEDKVITHYFLRCPIPANIVTRSQSQMFNSSDPLGLQPNIIPIYGFINKGKGAGYEPEAVKMRTNAAIVKVVLTNNSAAAKTIDHLTMECSGTDVMAGLQGDGTWIIMTPSLVESSYAFHVNMLSKTITLDCEDYILAKDATRAFSFVVLGGQRRSTLENLTWKAYEDGNDTPIWTYTNTYGTKPGESTTQLEAGKVYTVTGAL